MNNIYDTDIWQQMLSGQPYPAPHPTLLAELARVKDLLHIYNVKTLPSDTDTLSAILQDLLGAVGTGVKILPPFRCDFGHNIRIGNNSFANFNLTILDEGRVTIGDNVFIGPNVSIYTACHPLDWQERNKGTEWSKDVRIGHNVWIGGSVTIVPGVTIGDNVTIGAGSVVVHDIPANTLAVGNPAKVCKDIPTSCEGMDASQS